MPHLRTAIELPIVLLAIAQVLAFDYICLVEQMQFGGFLPLWSRITLTNGIALLGIGLAALSRNRREWPLAAVFILIAASFADSLLLTAGDGLDLSTPGAKFLTLPADAFLPYFLWRFFSIFPSSTSYHRLNPLLHHLGTVSFGVGLVLVALQLTGTTLFDRAHPLSHYWTVVYLLLLPVFPLAYVKARSSVAEERTRILLFLNTFLASVLPVAAVVLLSLIPGVRDFILLPAVRPFVVGSILLLMGLMLGTAAYAVLAGDVFQLRTRLTMALRYAVAHVLVTVMSVTPLLFFMGFLFEHREQSLAAIFSELSVGAITAFAVTQGAFLYFRGALSERIDRLFFRRKSELDPVLVQANRQILGADTTAQMAAAATALIEQHVNVDQANLLLVGEDHGLSDPLRRCAPLHANVLEQPLADDTHHLIRLQSPEASGSADFEAWVRNNAVDTLVPVRDARTDALIGILALSTKRSELPPTPAELELLHAMAFLCAAALNRLQPDQQLPVIAETQPAPDALACGMCRLVILHTGPHCPLCGGELAPLGLPARLCGRFQLEQVLGEGAEGRVYRARDLHLDRLVAIKTLAASASDDIRKLTREARTIASVQHRHLAQVYGLEMHGDIPIIVLEYLEGGSLRDRIRKGPLTIEALCKFLLQMADALEAIHKRGYVHGDIKPENVGFDAAGDVKLMDFGIARLQGSLKRAGGHLTPGGRDSTFSLGTTAYLSPWLIRGELVDPKNDLWALGVTAYEAATGKHPFARETVAKTKQAILLETPNGIQNFNPSVPPWLEDGIHALFSKSNEDLHASIRRLRPQLVSTATH